MFDKLREELNRESLKYTYKYQKIRGFKIDKGKEATHNNDADAFKHAFYASLFNDSSSVLFG